MHYSDADSNVNGFRAWVVEYIPLDLQVTEVLFGPFDLLTDSSEFFVGG